MEVPVMIGGCEAGRLRVSREGLYTVLEAELFEETKELARLWVHGGGKSAYLGAVGGGERLLRRRLSRRELAAFPDPPELVSDREREESLHNSEPAPVAEPCPQSDYRSCPWPAEPPEEGLLWYRRLDGSLVAFDGVSSLVAIPAELRGPGGRVTERVIEGRKYLVFRY